MGWIVSEGRPLAAACRLRNIISWIRCEGWAVSQALSSQSARKKPCVICHIKTFWGPSGRCHTREDASTGVVSSQPPLARRAWSMFTEALSSVVARSRMVPEARCNAVAAGKAGRVVVE